MSNHNLLPSCDKIIQCPCCEGRGLTFDFVCCQLFDDAASCCASPDVQEVECRTCFGEHFVNLEQFKAFAIYSANPELVAQYEALVMLEEVMKTPNANALQPFIKNQKTLRL